MVENIFKVLVCLTAEQSKPIYERFYLLECMCYIIYSVYMYILMRSVFLHNKLI